ncbi:MAG: hypothetical protein Q4C00_08000, partial [Bacillota bacterium]|nr:hypothetical protein [Bacillota bacterium]
KILSLFMPLITIACIIAYVFSAQLLSIVGGEKYIAATPILRGLLPMVFISFPAMLFGWPCLGAIDKPKQTTITTISAAVFQVSSLAFLISMNIFTITNLIIARSATEFILFATRAAYCFYYRAEFKKPTGGIF